MEMHQTSKFRDPRMRMCICAYFTDANVDPDFSFYKTTDANVDMDMK